MSPWCAGRSPATSSEDSAAPAVTVPVSEKMFMAVCNELFDWIDFPQGRVRYVGQKRGREEPPIYVFSVHIDGWTYSGELRRSYLQDRNHYDLEVVSFGWIETVWFGTFPDPKFCASFTVKQLEGVQILVGQAVVIWYAMSKRPAILFKSAKSGFAGAIHFSEGWALLKDNEDATRCASRRMV